MEEDEQEERRRKVEAGRAKLASFRQRKAKGDGPNSKKKTAKRKGSAVNAPVQEEGSVATPNSELPQEGAGFESKSCSRTLEGTRGAFAAQEQDCELDETGLQAQQPQQQQQQLQLQPQPPQTAHSLELEALRLSLNNMHTAQLELTQANLQKEKETALTELREMLNGRRAQELALLQSRQQCELELMREQHAREKEAVMLRCGQETAELKEKLRSEMEKNVQMIETLKQDLESERELCLENLRKELSAKHQSEMEGLQNQFQKELAEQRAELEKIFQAKHEAEVSLKNLETQHQAAVEKLQADLQAEHCQYLQDLEVKFREKEKEKELELETLQASYEDLKAQSQEEIRHLWSQLESMKTNREELNGSWELPLARDAHLEELEHLRADFAKQQQQERAQHELELEHLRVYFEKKLRDAEKTYQEDLTLFQQRLQETREDSLECGEISSSCIFPEETFGPERKEQPDPLDLQLEQPKENSTSLHAGLEEDPRHEAGVLSSSLDFQLKEDKSHSHHLRPEEAEQERLPLGFSDQHSQELTQGRLQYEQDMALEVDAQVAARILSLEAEQKVKLSLLQTELKEEIELLKIENRNLQEKLQHETHLKEDLENVKRSLVEDHQVKLNKAEEKIQLLKQEFQRKEAEWERSHEALKREAEERLTSMFLELREKAECEKQSIISRFELRESGMKHLQDQQAAQILDLERSLMEQQGRLRELEQELTRDEALPCSQCGQEPLLAQDEEHATLLREKEDCALQLMMAQNRFLEERKEIMEKFAKEQDAFFRDAQEKHTHELQLLQQGHQQQLQALRIELETKHHSELAEQLASLESRQQVLLETHVAELQVKHNAEISALEMRHLSSLDALESCYLADIQTIRDEHRKALELLRAELEEQLQKKDSSHKELLTHELEKLKLKHDEELQSAKDSLRVRMHARHTGTGKDLATDLQGAQQEELAVALHNQRHLLEKDGHAALGSMGAEVLQHQAVPEDPGAPHTVEMQKPQAELAKPPELKASQEQAAQLKDKVFSLSRELQECRTELERLQQRRERENQEGATLICMLRADADLARSEGKVLRDALRRLLDLFGETLKAAVALKSRISERAGLLLDHVDAADTSDARLAAAALGDMWSDEGLLEIDRTLPEGAETSSVSEISSHVCESFFMSPENTLECEQPIRKVYQSLSSAVDGLLEMALDSTKQLEEARQLHRCVEKEFRHRNEEMAQAVQKQQELLERLRQESAAKDGLTLELHTAEGLLEGLKVEKADLQETLGKKEESEQQLILELENLQNQLQQAAQELATLREENSILWNQKETFTNEAKEREAALQKEVESLTRDQWEARKQSEKDRATLLSQMRVLESELEDQLVQHRGCAQLTEEVTTLKQQLSALDKHLRSQRQFMDEQAAEREHEREEFQQEIQKLEEQLRQAARPRPPGSRDSQCAQLDEEVELLQEKLREKLDGFNELVIKKDFADQQLLIQEEEIKRLEETNVNIQRQMAQLQEELEKQKRHMEEFKDKEVLKQEHASDLLPPPVPQCRADEAAFPVPSQDSPPRGPETQPEVPERALLQLESEVVPSRNSEIEELKAIIENLREDQEQLQKNKAEEIEQLHEVIEKLQSELTLMGPKVHELSDHQANSLHDELSCLHAEGQREKDLRNELEAAQATKVFGQLLADQAHGHSQVLEALQQRLQDAEEVAARRLADLEHCVALKEAEVEGMASQIQEFEAILKAKEAVIVQRDLEIDTIKKWKVTHSLELETILLALTHFCHALEQQTLATPEEPPELQQLRKQCARLSHQLQELHRRFLSCQVELDRQQAHAESVGCSSPCADAQAKYDGQLEQDSVSTGLALVPRSSAPQDNLQPAKVLVTLKDASLHKAESVMSVLAVCQRWLEAEMLLVKNAMPLSLEDDSEALEGMQAKEKQPEACQLGSATLIAQVKQLQEKLNHLVCSMASRDTSAENPKLPQPNPSENGSSNNCHNDEEGSVSPPVDGYNIAKTTWDVIDVIKSQDLLAQNEMPSFPPQETLTLQGRPLSSQISVHTDSLHTEGAEPLKDPVRALDLSSWSSPEVLRKDSSLEPQHSLPLTPHTSTVSLHSVDTSSQGWTDSLLLADASGLLCYPGRSAAGQAPLWVVAPSAENCHVEKPAAEKDVEDFIVTSFDSQELLTSLHELARRSDGSGKSNGPSSALMLTLGSGGSETPTTSLVTATAGALPLSGRFVPSPEAMKEKEIHAKHMKALLQMVFDESHQILALSENQDLPNLLSKGEPLDGLPRDRQALLEVTADRREKESLKTHLTWSEELLRALQEVFAREQENAGLQSRPYGLDLGDYNALFKRLEKVIQERGDLQKVQEHLCLPDRRSLLSEVQALRAQLRMTHLQNQEKLQQLCAALTSTEARGSQREHQLRRQVELLAYKVEQEKCIANDLQKTLSKEQEKASDVRKLLMVEQSAVQDLKSELHACKQENTRLLESLDKVQQEVLRLRAMLDGKENELKVALEELECERGKERALQAQQEEQQLRHLQKEGQSSRALEELKMSLEKQRAQNSQLCVALKHERAAKDNLQKELQIESSRCEALLAQEKGQLYELQKSLEAERSRSLELSEALQHERLLTEQLSRNAQEACARQEAQVQHALLRKLKAEKARALELEGMLEKVQRQAAQAQKQLESQAQERCVELRKEKEVSSHLRSAVDALQSHKQELGCCLEREREKSAWLQAELEQLSTRVKEQEGLKDARRMERRSSRADVETKTWQTDKEKLRELELQRQRDEHKIEQLQRMVRELTWKEKVSGGDGPCWSAPNLGSLEPNHVQEQQQELEKIRQQLLCAAGLLTSFTNHTVDRTIKDWTSSNEKAVSSLMHTLEELKSELSMPTSSKKKMSAELQVQLMNELLRDNDALTKAVSIATREKAELCRTVSRLEKTLKHHTQKGCLLNRQSKSSWKQDGTVLQGSPRLSEPEWHTPTASVEASSCNTKMEKLYLHYLRAESFRKALIYQKKYLLLLIGGFQDSEQETLSMIAHLGVFPSKADKKTTTSRPFTKFRTAVRVVIAVLRLRFLVKKWQEVDRKGALIHCRNTRQGHRMSRRQHSPSETRTSLPTREVSSGHIKDSRHSPRSSAAVSLGKEERSTSSPNSRLERSLAVSQDAEHSLTEYIHHLEMIQQRLGGLPPDSTQKSCHQKIKQ
ncbi:pericentrin isoform X2 [Arvicola amphibius]|uniref:pericentrin isoform X2 n=1 Tax=Arvicola amphibius TaxID=1047088 RepID=UPI0018E3F4AF|nr:pericentrin isoform X2 [Arvicola amphibius]